jgi:WXXGXW repeat (2 copies)
MFIARLIRSVCLLLLGLGMLAFPSESSAHAVSVSITIAPPVLPVYVQPVCPGDGYIWTPGYWAYGDYGYFWVPGMWVLAPTPGFLWTPGYWGWGGGVYTWHAGYWGPRVGFYGGINYGFGYVGTGYAGGYWSGRHFYYNRAVNNVNITNIHNTYNTTVINNTTVNRASFTGGNGGTTARPTAAEESAGRERHIPPTAQQALHEHVASADRHQFASVNHGKPALAATPKPGESKGNGAVAARPAAHHKGELSDRSTNHETSRPGNSAGNETHSATRVHSNASTPARTNAVHTENKARTQADSHARPRQENASHGPAQHQNTPQTENRPATPRPHQTAAHPQSKPQIQPESHTRPQHESAPHKPAQHQNTPQTENRPATPRPHQTAAHLQSKPRTQPESHARPQQSAPSSGKKPESHEARPSR